MKLNNTPNSKLNSFQVLVSVNVDNDNYTIGRFKFENSKQWEEVKKKIEDDHFHPTEEFVKLIKSKYSYLDTDDIARSIVTFIFVDEAPIIEL